MNIYFFLAAITLFNILGCFCFNIFAKSINKVTRGDYVSWGAIAEIIPKTEKRPTDGTSNATRRSYIFGAKTNTQKSCDTDPLKQCSEMNWLELTGKCLFSTTHKETHKHIKKDEKREFNRNYRDKWVPSNLIWIRRYICRMWVVLVPRPPLAELFS